MLSNFKNPSYTAKPMGRMWFPDNSAGADDSDTIEKQIQELAEAGFGGVKVTMLADSSNLTNADVQQYGWGTENHV